MSPLSFAVILFFRLLTPRLHQEPPFIHIGIGATSLILVTDRLASLGLGDTSNHLVYPVWQPSMGIPMFPKSCKYLLCDLMSADSISDHKDISWLPHPCQFFTRKILFFASLKILEVPKKPKRNVMKRCSNFNILGLIQKCCEPHSNGAASFLHFAE